MLKELTIKASMAYNDEDFKETIEAFVEGKKNLKIISIMRLLIFRLC